MEDEQQAVNVLAMGESMSIDYGVLIAINSTGGNSNCTVRFKNGCSPREKLHFRFWPGDISPSQTSQGLMALTVMLILLCLVVTYCCWGTCCKLIQKRRSRNRRTRSQSSFDSSGSCADPRFMMWSPHLRQHHHHEMCSHHSDSASAREQQSRNHFIVKPRILRSEIPPPPYETLFGQENVCAPPPTYEELVLNQSTAVGPISLPNGNHGAIDGPVISTNSFVAVVIEQDIDIRDDVVEERQFLRSQSVPASIDSSSQTKYIPVQMRTGNDATV